MSYMNLPMQPQLGLLDTLLDLLIAVGIAVVVVGLPIYLATEDEKEEDACKSSPP